MYQFFSKFASEVLVLSSFPRSLLFVFFFWLSIQTFLDFLSVLYSPVPSHPPIDTAGDSVWGGFSAPSCSYQMLTLRRKTEFLALQRLFQTLFQLSQYHQAQVSSASTPTQIALPVFGARGYSRYPAATHLGPSAVPSVRYCVWTLEWLTCEVRMTIMTTLGGTR